MSTMVVPSGRALLDTNRVRWTSVTCSCPKVARKRRTTSRPDRCRPAVRARGLGHRPAWPATLEAGAVIADKAYIAVRLLDVLHRKGITPVAPSRSDQPENPDFDRRAYRGRNLVERLVGKLKQFRRITTR